MSTSSIDLPTSSTRPSRHPALALAAAALAVASVAAVSGCGPKAVFGLTSDDNNADQLGRALAGRTLAAAPAVSNALGKPLVLAVIAGTPKKLIAYDAAAGATLWKVDADVQSRVAVAGPLVVAREGGKVVIRDVTTGAPRGSITVDGDLVGATTDGEQVYVTYQHASVGRPVWTLAAYGPDGKQRWKNDAPGALGAPAAQGGLVLSPFLTQWLSILDARTGEQLTRIRGIDQEITFVRTTSDGAWFGSKAGIFRLDVRASSGTRSGSTYGAAALPKQLATATYDRDAFDPVQAGYSAFDRKRVLWRGTAKGDGPLTFDGDVVVVHFFRFLFGLSPAGDLRWAYSQPRVELVASAHAGRVVVGVAADGSVIAVDPATGALQATGKIDAGGQVLGATFDCDGWAPTGQGETPTTVAALVAIARDRDQRFDEIKQFAVAALAKLEGADVAKDLLAIVQDPRTPLKLRESVVELLVGRKDPAGLPALLVALELRHDYITGSQPAAVAAIARAIGGMGERELTAAQRDQAVTALAAQAEDPATPTADRLELVRAMIAVGQGAEHDRLRRQLLMYRADPGFAGEAALVEAIARALAAGGAEARETLRYVAEDPRTVPATSAIAKSALR